MSIFQGSMTGFNAFTRSFIQSVQQFSITISATSTSNTATISSVDTSRSFIVFQGSTTTNNTDRSGASVSSYVQLTNSTTVTATRGGTTFDTTVYGVVVQCTPNLVSSVQQGTLSISASTSGTATISSVTTSRAAVFHLGQSTTDTTSSLVNWCTNIEITNATTLTANVGTSGTLTVGYAVVEFQANVIQSMQQFSMTSTSTTTTMTATISSVTQANVLLLHNGQTAGQANASNSAFSISLTSSTVVTATRGGTNSASRTLKGTAIEFVPNVLVSRQQSSTTLAATTSADTTITKVNFNAFCNFQGFNSTATGASSATYMQNGTLLNETTVRCVRNAAGTPTGITEWSVVEFY